MGSFQSTSKACGKHRKSSSSWVCFTLLISLSFGLPGDGEEYREIQQEIEQISRDREIGNYFNRVQNQISDNSLSGSAENLNDEDISGRDQTARCAYEENCYRSGYWGGIVCDCRECCEGNCNYEWNWVSWVC